MTTTVTVEAHCDAKTTLVRVEMDGAGNAYSEPVVYLEDGEKREFHVYDDRIILVCEMPRRAKEGDEGQEDKQ